MKRISYTKFLKEFLRHATGLLADLIPGKKQLARRDICSYLEREKEKLTGWFKAAQLNYISAEEYGKLFNRLPNSFPLKTLYDSGIDEAQVRQLTDLLRKLFRAVFLLAAKEGYACLSQERQKPLIAYSQIKPSNIQLQRN